MTDTDSPLARLQRARAACDAGIAAAEQGMAEALLVDFYADYEERRAAWLMIRNGIDRRIAELPRRPAHIGWRRLLTTITRGLL